MSEEKIVQETISTQVEEAVSAETAGESTKPSKKGIAFKVISLVLIGVLLLSNVGAGLYIWQSKGKPEATLSATDNLFGSEGLVSVKSGDKWGFMNKSGKLIINPQFDNVSEFSEGLSCVRLDDKYGYINNKGEYVINLQFDSAYNFSEGLAAVKNGDNWGYIDRKGNYVVNPQFQSAYSFSDEGLAVVKSNGKWGFINLKGEFAVNPQFDDYLGFNNELIPVKLGNVWGFVDKNGEIVINYQYAEVNPMRDDGYTIAVTTDKKYIIIDKKGQPVGSATFAGIDGTSETFCQESGCYKNSYGDEYCSDHEEDTTYYPFCDYYSCFNRAYAGDYCTEHNYLE